MKRVKQNYVTAVNGLEALQIFQAEPLLFSVIFMGMLHSLASPSSQGANIVTIQTDISMPVMDGLRI